MNKIFNTDYKASTVSTGLLILRVGIAVLMLVHGFPKLQMLFSGDIQFLGIMGMSPTLSLILAVFSEVLCSILLLIGLGTRLATIPLIITMLIAVFLVHLNDPFASQELGLLYLLAYVSIFLLGAGNYSFDAVLQRYRTEK